jgi:3-phosphoshikimate 1-carboxyvinyltransferase
MGYYTHVRPKPKESTKKALMKMHSEILKVQPAPRLHGHLEVPGDKSISHRCLLFGALAQGSSRFKGISQGEDVQSTAACLRQLGVSITTSDDGETTEVIGVGLQGLCAPSAPLDCGNSGTTLRLLMGILAAQPFNSTLIGDASLSQRPMTRVSEPLAAFGAQIELTQGRFAPLHIHPPSQPLSGGNYTLSVASAQVKSALLLAGFYTGEAVTLSGLIQSRDHTEKMLPDFGAVLTTSTSEIHLPAGQTLQACDFTVPGDPSSAAFWLAAAALVPHSDVTVKNVSLNPTRIGFFEVLKKMGADICWELTAPQAEPVGDVRLKYRPLTGVTLSEADIPYLVDEVPLIALLATQAQGVTLVRGAQELRVKECDRLAAMETNLKAMGVQGWESFDDGFCITGSQSLNTADWEAFHDHRIAMVGVLAGLIAKNNKGTHQVMGAKSIGVSYPAFLKDLETLKAVKT